MFNLATILEESTRRYPDRVAIVFGDSQLSYRDLSSEVNRVANGIRKLGIIKGDKIALSCPNVPHFPIVYFAILKAGASVVPLNVLLKGREIAYHLVDSDAKAYFCFEGSEQLPMGQNGFEGYRDTVACENMILLTGDPNRVSPFEGINTLGTFVQDESEYFETVSTEFDDTAVILYTSGTTGQSKGAELSHANMLLNARLADNDVYLRKDPEVHLICLPLFHSFGQTAQMNCGIYTAGKLVLMSRFDPDEALSLMEKERVTYFAGVPTMYWAILNHPNAEKYDLKSISENLTAAVSGGAAMPVEVMLAFNKKFGVKILEGYGLSETSPIASFNHYKNETKIGSIGTPVWGVKMKIADSDGNELPVGEHGEVLIKGPNIMKGYYNRPEASAAAIKNGWLFTGDIGRMDEDGYFYITDRVKDMIIRGGFNVYPREIEEVLLSHEDVSLAAVIGVPHESHGEEIKAFVILKDGAKTSSESLIEWSKENMAAYKYPREIELVDSLPMTATGKILKRELRNS